MIIQRYLTSLAVAICIMFAIAAAPILAAPPGYTDVQATSQLQTADTPTMISILDLAHGAFVVSIRPSQPAPAPQRSHRKPSYTADRWTYIKTANASGFSLAGAS